MKKILGLILAGLILSVGAFLFLAARGANNSSGNTLPTTTNKKETEADKKLMTRRGVAKDSRAQLEAGGTTINLSGKDEDILELNATRLSDSEILNLLSSNFDKFRNLGFRQIVITDKTGNRREVNLVVLDK